MNIRTPQEIADFFDLSLVRQDGIWYGTTTPIDGEVKADNPAVVFIMLDRNEVLYAGKDNTCITPR